MTIERRRCMCIFAFIIAIKNHSRTSCNAIAFLPYYSPNPTAATLTTLLAIEICSVCHDFYNERGVCMHVAIDFKNAWKQDNIFVIPVYENLVEAEKIKNERYRDTTFEYAYKQKNCFCTPAD